MLLLSFVQKNLHEFGLHKRPLEDVPCQKHKLELPIHNQVDYHHPESQLIRLLLFPHLFVSQKQHPASEQKHIEVELLTAHVI